MKNFMHRLPTAVLGASLWREVWPPRPSFEMSLRSFRSEMGLFPVSRPPTSQS